MWDALPSTQELNSCSLARWFSSKSSSCRSSLNVNSRFSSFRHLCSASKDKGLKTQPDREILSNSNTGLSGEESAVYRSSKRHDLAMLFTCKVCETRSGKTMSRDTYENGIVIVRCLKCRNLHLIADRLGWFGAPGSVEDFLSQQGVEVRKGSEESYEFSVEDLAGWTPTSTVPKSEI